MKKFKEFRVAKRILKKKKAGLTLSNFKTHYKAAVTEAPCYCHKGGHAGWWNRTESPNKPSHSHSHSQSVDFDKGAKAIQWRKGHLFNTRC